jgi:hypothetical protein
MYGRVNLRNYLAVGTPKTLAKFVVDFGDNSKLIVATDNTWKVLCSILLYATNIPLGRWWTNPKE